MRLDFTAVIVLFALACSVGAGFAAQDVLVSDAKRCSDAALTRYALSGVEPAETIAELAFTQCIDKWRVYAETIGKRMDTEPALSAALESCTKAAGSSCRPRAPGSLYALLAARRTFRKDAVIEVLNIRARAGKVDRR